MKLMPFMSLLSMLDILHAVVVSITAGYVTSFPPSLHSVVVKAYDYPITRILLFASVLAASFYVPVTAIIYGIGIAIISEDIIRAAKYAKAEENEGFNKQVDDEELRKNLNIKVSKTMNPIEEAMIAVKTAEEAINRVMTKRLDK